PTSTRKRPPPRRSAPTRSIPTASSLVTGTRGSDPLVPVEGQALDAVEQPLRHIGGERRPDVDRVLLRRAVCAWLAVLDGYLGPGQQRLAAAAGREDGRVQVERAA